MATILLISLMQTLSSSKEFPLPCGAACLARWLPLRDNPRQSASHQPEETDAKEQPANLLPVHKHTYCSTIDKILRAIDAVSSTLITSRHSSR